MCRRVCVGGTYVCVAAHVSCVCEHKSVHNSNNITLNIEPFGLLLVLPHVCMYVRVVCDVTVTLDHPKRQELAAVITLWANRYYPTGAVLLHHFFEKMTQNTPQATSAESPSLLNSSQSPNLLSPNTTTLTPQILPIRHKNAQTQN